MFWSWDIIILKLPYASLRNALLQYHMIEIYHVIYFEYDSYSNRETDFQDTWKSELGIQKNLNSAYRKLENVVGKVRNKLGKILRNENFPTSFSFYLVSSGNFPTYWFYQLQFPTTCKTEIQFYPTLCQKRKVGTSKFLDTWILNFPFPFT